MNNWKLYENKIEVKKVWKIKRNKLEIFFVLADTGEYLENGIESQLVSEKKE